MTPEKIEQTSQGYVETLEAFREWFYQDPKFAIGTLAILLLGWICKKVIDNFPAIYSKFTLWRIERFSDFDSRYRQHIIWEHRVFNVRGLRTQGTFTLEVEKVYVGLKIAPSANPNKANSITHHEALEGNRPIWDFLQQGLKILAVIGAPGCGKSTLLQHIALAFAANKHRSHGLKAATPIFLFLREHIDKIVTDEINLADLAQAHFKNEKRYPHLNPPDKWFANKLASGKAIVLLDGLDEVADVEKRKKVSAWVENQIIAYRDCPFIVTSRPQGYLAAPLQQAHRLEIQPFSWSQVKEFAHSWYLQNEIKSFGNKKDEGVINVAKQKADDLLMRLQKMPALHDLTVNPLLLTMIVMVHSYRATLPEKRIGLYQEICDVLLEHWKEAVGLKDRLNAAQKRVALQPLAATMMQRNTREISTENAVKIINKLLNAAGLAEQEIGKQFLKDIEVGSGLLAEKENGLWSFAHLSFQEYLAACHWAEQKNERNWDKLVDKSWWHEAIRLYVAQSDASKVIEACLNINTVNSLVLASECLEERKILSNSSLQGLVEEQLLTNLESENEDLRKRAAEVRLKKRLKNLLLIDDKIEIDQSYISCAEYQLFLDEEYQKGHYFHPIHWKTGVFATGQANEPITGVRASDAINFCMWLNNHDASHEYRLPTEEELQAYRVQKNISAWSITNSKINLITTSKKINKNKLLVSDIEKILEGKIDINFNHVMQYLIRVYKHYENNKNENLPELKIIFLATLLVTIAAYLVGGVFNFLISVLYYFIDSKFEAHWSFGANLLAFIVFLLVVIAQTKYIRDCNFYKKTILFYCLHHIYFFGVKNKALRSDFLNLIKFTKTDTLKKLIKSIEDKNIFETKLIAAQLAMSTLKEINGTVVSKNKILPPELMEELNRDLTVINARIEGKEKAWEGIRIVRERKE